MAASSTECLKVFLQKTKQNPEAVVEFLVKGDENDARNFVQRMRAQLSKFRNKLRMAGGRPASFKMLADYADAEGGTLIKLRRQNDSEFMKVMSTELKDLVEAGLEDGE